jgi:hypothetical protein
VIRWEYNWKNCLSPIVRQLFAYIDLAENLAFEGQITGFWRVEPPIKIWESQSRNPNWYFLSQTSSFCPSGAQVGRVIWSIQEEDAKEVYLTAEPPFPLEASLTIFVVK